MIKLTKQHYILETWLQKYPHKNFSALTFFDFFWKEKKVITFPVSYLLSPWGLTTMGRESHEQGELSRTGEYAEIKYFSVKNIQFYITIFLNSQGIPKNLQFLNWFQPFLGRGSFILEKRNGDSWVSYRLKNNLFSKWEKLMREQVYDQVMGYAESSILSVLSYVEQNLGPVIKPEDILNHWTMPTEIIDKIGFSGKNFCLNTPSQIRINLEEHFSKEELVSLIKEVSKLGYGENPFPGKIETSIEEYKEFLLTLYGPGKWEYTNLYVETLDLTIEELLLLFSLCQKPYGPISSDPLNLPYFLPDEQKQSFRSEFPYKYFWYRLKHIVEETV